MNYKKLIKQLAQILTDLGHGDVFLTTCKDHGYGEHGIWTGMGESGICDYWQDPAHENLDPQIRKWLDENDLFLEWHNAGVVCIYSTEF